MTRRDLLLGARRLGALLAAAIAAPSLLFWWRSGRDPGVSSDGAWVDLGSARKLPEDEWIERRFVLPRFNRWRIDVGEQMVYIFRRDRDLTVVTAVCPHAACLVRPDGEGFACPCHRSSFDPQGRPLDGPAPRPLDRLEWKVEKGRLKVRFQEFRSGIATSEALGA